MLRIVRACLRCRHPVAFAAVKSDVDLESPGLKCTVPKLIEDVMGIEGTIIAADSRVVAPDDEVRATKILANEGMKQRLARTRVAHLDAVARLNDCPRAEIVVDHRTDRPGANFGGNVARFQLSQHLMDENTVQDIDGDLGQML